METTKPFLYIDLSKAWREELHPRDKYGRFTTVKGGSRVVTKTGKTGVVEEVTDTHYHVRYDDGRKGKVAKDNAIHVNDHKKVMDAQKAEKAKAKKRKAAAEKAKKTKEHNKTNATGKTGAAKPLKDPTATAPKKAAKKASEAKKATAKAAKPKKQSRAKEALNAPVLKRNVRHDTEDIREIKQTIPQKKASEVPKSEQNEAIREYKEMETKGTGSMSKLDMDWNSHPDVKRILSQPVAKRNAEEIRRVAGEIANANDKLARSVVLKMGNARGLHLASQVNRIGNKATNPKNVIVQETNYYGDMLQSARATMYETLHNVLAGSQNPGKDTSIGKHVVRRMKDKLHRDMYALLNDIPAPHEIRAAIGDMRKAEMHLTQKLGRIPTNEELGAYLQENSKAFREAPIVKPPKWDEAKNDWVATKERYEDPAERLQALRNYASQQKATSLDQNIGSEGEREVSLKDSMADDSRSPEEHVLKKERQSALEDAVPKAFSELGLTDDEIKVLLTKHSAPSTASPSKASLTDEETAEQLNAQHGMKVDGKWVANRRASAMKKLQRALEEKHPALMQLHSMMKSFALAMIFKALYEYDLVKSLHAWGVDHTLLQQRFVRKATAQDRIELYKSLAPHEYVGSYVTTDEGHIIANVVEFVLPETNALYKSFNAFMSGIQKSMFAHKGKNHEVNKKASEYVKANSGKYQALANSQQERVKQKKSSGKALTWSEELLLKNPGTCWITWGGKKILIHGSTGEIKYDSANEAHREEHNQGAQEEKIDFHHEREALEEHESEAEKRALEAWEKEGKNLKGNFRTKFLRDHRLTENEDGTVTFNRHQDVSEDNRHLIDHGIRAFHEEMSKMKSDWDKLHAAMKEENKHKVTNHYADMSEEERAEYDKLSREEQAIATGNHLLDKEGVLDRLKRFHDEAQGKSKEEQAQLAEELLNDLKGMEHGSMALVNKKIMLGGGANLAGIAGALLEYDPTSEEGRKEIAKRIGTSELARANEEAGKNLIAEGKYLIGNPLTGKTMVVHVGHAFEGGRGGRGGKLAPVIKEAFDPEGGQHEDLQSWGGLARALGFKNEKGNTADLKKLIIDSANKDANSPMVKPLSEDEYLKHRANTKLGLQETMLHKEFKLVNQSRDDKGNITSQTFAQKMPDGTVNHITVDGEGYIQDPLMRRLLNQRKPVTNEKELNELLKNAVGNRRWVTAHFGSDIHIGDALGHHILLEYDGKGAPRVVGGKYDGYRYIDAADVPKGAIDPATGEPVKALFKNGKLVDRRFTTMNEVPMEVGNAVLYPTGNGTFRKGRIHSEVEGGFKITDGKGHVIGVFKKSELKPAKQEGRILSESGQVVVDTHQEGVHRMNVDEAFKPASDKKRDIARAEKAKALFAEALRKAKVNKAFDEEGNLRSDLELSDPMMRRLQKVLGRSKAGREMLAKFSTTKLPATLKIHVPESQRSTVEQYGVTVRADGTATISPAKFEELREALGGLSLTHRAQEMLQEHFQRKDRTPKTVEELKQRYQPSQVPNKGEGSFGYHYQQQFKPNSFLMDANKGLYGTQLEGVAHMIERGRVVVGHGINLHTCHDLTRLVA